LLSTLLLMEDYYHEFAQQLVSDPYIVKIFAMQLGERIHRTAKKTLPVELTIVLIVHGLNNSTRFAIRRKERLKDHVSLLYPPDLKSHMIHEVISDLVRVVDVIVHFVEHDQDLDEIFEAGRWLKSKRVVSCLDR
jgi:hypothetical protein